MDSKILIYGIFAYVNESESFRGCRENGMLPAVIGRIVSPFRVWVMVKKSSFGSV